MLHHSSLSEAGLGEQVLIGSYCLVDNATEHGFTWALTVPTVIFKICYRLPTVNGSVEFQRGPLWVSTSYNLLPSFLQTRRDKHATCLFPEFVSSHWMKVGKLDM